MGREGAINRFRGDTFPFFFTATDGGGNAIDITGYSFLMTVNTEENPAAATEEFQLTGSIVVALNGTFTFTPTAVQMDLAPATYFYDIQSIDGSGNIRTMAKDRLNIIQDITK